MAADRSRLAAALAYKQAEEERRRRMLESIPTPAGTAPAQPAPQADFRTNLENLSIGVGEGLTNQLEGIRGLVTDPVSTAKGVYEAGKAVVRDPAIIASALRQMGQKVMSGPLGAGEVIGEMFGPRKTGPVMAELDVYHGTPHRFPATEANPLGEFDASKIGTGEGAQAYGHGIYLAEAKDVADQYANMPKFKLGVVENAQELGNNAKSFVERVEKFGSVEKAKVEAQELLREMQKQNIFPAVQQQLANEIDVANKLEKKIKVKATGIEPQVYKADLPDEMIDRMLDWDASIKSQPENVRQAVELFMNKYGVARTADIGTLISAMEREMPSSMVSEKLRDAGIPGIKYKDAGSRGQGGSGTRNFVVFPGEEKKVRILERK